MSIIRKQGGKDQEQETEELNSRVEMIWIKLELLWEMVNWNNYWSFSHKKAGRKKNIEFYKQAG